jgi:hypothetical protein
LTSEDSGKIIGVRRFREQHQRESDMGNLWSSGKGVWNSAPGLDDAEALLGGFGQEPLAALAAVLVLAIACLLALRLATPSNTVHWLPAPRPASATHAFGTPLGATHVHRVSKKAGRSVPSFTRSDRKPVLGFRERTRDRVLDLRSSGVKSNASLERGPPAPGTVNYQPGPIARSGTSAFALSAPFAIAISAPGSTWSSSSRDGRLDYEPSRTAAPTCSNRSVGCDRANRETTAQQGGRHG